MCMCTPRIRITKIKTRCRPSARPEFRFRLDWACCFCPQDRRSREGAEEEEEEERTGVKSRFSIWGLVIKRHIVCGRPCNVDYAMAKQPASSKKVRLRCVAADDATWCTEAKSDSSWQNEMLRNLRWRLTVSCQPWANEPSHIWLIFSEVAVNQPWVGSYQKHT